MYSAQRLIPMCPDGTVEWQIEDPTDHDGLLYVAPNTPRDVVELVLANLVTVQDDLVEIGSGDDATVYKAPDEEIALKHFDGFRMVDEESGLSGLRANVILDEGLKRKETTHYFRPLRAPAQLAAFIPNPDNELELPTWVMEYVGETTPGFGSTPPLVRKYANPIKSVGANPTDIHYDNNPGNFIRVEDATQGTAYYKLDVTAVRPFSW